MVGFLYDQPASEPSSSGAPAGDVPLGQALKPLPKEAEEKPFRAWFDLPEALGGRVPLTQRHHKVSLQVLVPLRRQGLGFELPVALAGKAPSHSAASQCADAGFGPVGMPGFRV